MVYVIIVTMIEIILMQRLFMEGWLSGLRCPIGNRVNVFVPQVRILLPPPFTIGKLAERFNAVVLKTTEPATVPGVRIPHFPPFTLNG